MGLIAGLALENAAGGMQAEAAQQQAHEFKMDEMKQELAIWEKRMSMMGGNMLQREQQRGQNMTDVQNLKNDQSDANNAVKYVGGGNTVQTLFGGGSPAAAQPSGAPASTMQLPASMPTTFTPPNSPDASNAPPDATSPAPGASAPAPNASPLIPGAPAAAAPQAPATAQQDPSAALTSKIMGAAPTTPAQTKQSVTALMAHHGFDDASITRILQAGAVKAANDGKGPEYLASTAQFLSSVEAGDFKTAANIGVAMHNAGWVDANAATTITSKFTGESNSTPFGIVSGDAKATTAAASETRADNPKNDKAKADAKAALDDAQKMKEKILGYYAKMPNGEDAFVKKNQGNPVLDDLTQANGRIRSLQSKYDQLNGVPMASPSNPTPSATGGSRPPLASFSK